MGFLRNWRSRAPVGPTLDKRVPDLEFLEKQMGKTSYSWEGEDTLAIKLFTARIGQTSGCFVDIGAHHPLALSNTYALYKRGWRGLNIDATPGSMEPFKKYRPEDINLEIAVGRQKETLPFTIFIYSEAPDQTLNDQAWAAAFILMAFVFVSSLTARYLLSRSERKLRGR